MNPPSTGLIPARASHQLSARVSGQGSVETSTMTPQMSDAMCTAARAGRPRVKECAEDDEADPEKMKREYAGGERGEHARTTRRQCAGAGANRSSRNT